MKILQIVNTARVCAVAMCAGAWSAWADIDLNGSWQFRFEEGKSIEQVADAAFEATDTMTVPGCYDMMPRWYLKRGTGLYRRTFTLEQPVENAWLVIDGVGLRGDFRLDGRSLGVHPYPYAKLELETGPLAAGEHTLFAALDNRFDWTTMKLAEPFYDFYFYGGIYRGARLVFDNRRLFVRTRDHAKGRIEIEAVNFKTRDFATTLVFDGVHKVPATFRNGRAEVTVPFFKLWTPETPNLHRVALFDGAHPIAARFGIRTIEARAKKLWLNGKEIFLKGVNRHDQNMEFGVSTSESQMVRDLQLIKALDANFIRGAHYQQSQRFLDLCDEMGLLVWEESLGWENGCGLWNKINELKDPAFCAGQIKITRDMVRESFNHPSVIIFGFLNECASEKPECKELVDQLIATIKAEDSGRLVTFACNHLTNDICNENTDLVAFNAYPGGIPARPGSPGELLAQVHESRQGLDTATARFRAKYPDKPIMVSESGCGGLYGYYDPAASVGSEDFQNEYVTDLLKVIWANPDLVGFGIWQFADNRTYHRNSGTTLPSKHLGISIAGLYTAQRQPKKSVETVRTYFRQKQ